MKKCTKCNTDKECQMFGKDSKRKDGLNSWCRVCCSAYYSNNKNRIQSQNKIYREKMKDVVKEKREEYFEAHKEEKAEYDREYRIRNADTIRKYKKEWENRNRTDPIFKLKRNLRRRIHHMIVGNRKSASSIELLGCSAEEFKSYLESKFQPGMTWENYGVRGWHVDHIRPCCDFDLTDASQQKQCFNYKNCQPLWEADNLRKSYMFEGINCRIKD